MILMGSINTYMNDLNESKQAFLESGGKLTHKNVQKVLRAAEDRARTDATWRSSPPNQWAADTIKKGLGYLAVFFFVIILTLGVGVLLIIIPAAEFVAVYTGLHTITPDTRIAGLTTGAVFIGVIVLMFLRHVFEDSLPGDRPTWFSKNLSKVERDYVALKMALSITKITILGASLLGRLNTTYQLYREEALGEFLDHLRTGLTTQEFIGAFVSLLVLYAILTMLDVGVLFTYTAFKNSAGKLDIAEVTTEDFLPIFERLSEEYQAEALDDLTLQMQVQMNKQQESNE